MCGRYTLARSQQELSERYGIKQLFMDFTERYNIAPTQKVPVVLNLAGQRAMEPFQWGLIPSWVTDLKKTKPLINARCETLAQKPSFKAALSKRRCLVPADGFYEWKKSGAIKRPMFIHQVDNAIFSFAGIWEEWCPSEADADTAFDAETEPLRTFSIITSKANDTMAPVHDRMPVILSREDEARWLDTDITDPTLLLPMLQPCANELITMHEVSPLVNSVRTDNAELIEHSVGQLQLKLF
jgi:putative SOS response-associated peptidase YedK